MNKTLPLLFVILLSLGFYISNKAQINQKDDNILSHIINTKETSPKLYWKDSSGELYRNFKSLKKDLEKDNNNLLFATNGGMYMENRVPLGLFIQNGEIKKRINKVQEAYGNFYLQPNGIFYLKKDKSAHICKTFDFKNDSTIEYATQSGPMLIIEGNIHSAFNKESKNTNIRNGVGILPNGEVIFAQSKVKTNFYDFAQYFKEQGCKNALFLDGFVSRTYLPEKKWEQTDGDFGVIFGVIFGETSN